MNRITAYALLSAELERWRLLPREQLLAHLDAPPATASATIDGELISIEVKVCWADDRRTRLRLEGIAYGFSNWKLERLEEAIILHPAECT